MPGLDEALSLGQKALGNAMGLGGVGLAGYGTLRQMLNVKKQNRALQERIDKLNAIQLNPEYAKQQALTQTQAQGRMAGASQAEQNIYQQAANTQANINRASTDPMQAILGAGAIQGQTSQAFNQLATLEQADYANRLQRYMQAGLTRAQAEDALNMDKYQMETQLKGAQQENIRNKWGSLANLGFATANLGYNMAQGVGNTGGLGSTTSKGAGTTMTSPTSTQSIYNGSQNFKNDLQIPTPNLGSFGNIQGALSQIPPGALTAFF